MSSGWRTQPLAELCEFRRGLTYAKRDQVDFSDNVVVRATNIDASTNQLDFSELRYISDEVAVPDGKKMQRGALLICTASGSKSHLGKVAYIDDEYDYAFGGFMGLIAPSTELHPRYLYYLMISGAYKDFIAALSDGTNINNLKFSDLGRLPVPYPSVSEQQRIVAILDEAFEGIAIAKANAEQNVENARALYDSYIYSVLSGQGDGWTHRTVGEMADSISTGPFGTMLHKSDYVADGIPLVNPMNLVQSQIVPSGKMMVSEETRDRLSGYALQGGDIVIGRRGELGRCALVTDKETGWLCGTGSFFVRLRDEVDGEFFVLFFSSLSVKTRLEESSVGATMSSLNIRILGDLTIPVPTIAEQRRIVAEAHALLSDVRSLESVHKRKLHALDALKKSLLNEAFAGNL